MSTRFSTATSGSRHVQPWKRRFVRVVAAWGLAAASGTAALAIAPSAVADGPTTFTNASAVAIPAAGGPYTVAEGKSLSLDGTGSIAPPGATFTWDLNGDGVFGDATGPTPTLNWSQLEALGINDGPSSHVVTLRVTDGGDSVTDTASLQVTNVGSSVRVTFNVNIQTGVPVSFQLEADDASSADMAANFTYHANWGDGSPIEDVVGPTTVTVTHTYLAPETVTAFFSATDKDGGAQEANGVEFDISGPTITTTTTTSATSTTTGTTTTGTTTDTTTTGTTTSSGATSPVSTHTPPPAGTPSLAGTGSNAGLSVFLAGLLIVCGGTLVALARWKGTSRPR